jgi:8-oxo-dGTP pyrophosphatase MutT (NUDIX family)
MDYNTIEELTVESIIEAVKQADSQKMFNIFLNADSLLKLTPEDKTFYTMLFHGKDNQKEIAKKLGMNYNSFRVKRSKLYEEYIRCKLHYVLLDMTFSKQPKRIYNKKPAVKQNDLTRIPYFVTPDSEIKNSAATKDALHTNSDLSEYIHATVIIMMAKRLPDGELFFLTCDKKAYNMDNIANEVLPVQNRYDSPAGGHLELQDFPAGENKLSDEAFLNCAVRELHEEIYMRNAVLQPEKLQFLFKLNYNKNSSASGRYNNEVSHIYFYPLESQADVRIRERYTDTIGKSVKRELPIKYFTYEQLKSLPEENQCDGIGRVISEMKKSPKLYENIKSLF